MSSLILRLASLQLPGTNVRIGDGFRALNLYVRSSKDPIESKKLRNLYIGFLVS